MTPEEREISDRMHELVTAQLEGDPTAADERELTQLLREHPWAQELYVEFIQDTASLRWWSANVPATINQSEIATLIDSDELVTRRAKRGVRMYAALAASILVVLAVAALSQFRGAPPVTDDNKRDVPPTQPIAQSVDTKSSVSPQSVQIADDAPASVALVTRLRGVKWAENAAAIAEWSRLPVGQVLQFREGELEIYFDHAVQLVVRGPAKVEIRSAREVYSEEGILAARVGKSGIGFTIETPAGRITDLGTEFGVAIGDRGATEVAVFRGAVGLTYGSRNSKLQPSLSRRLVQGQALRLDSDGHMRRLVAIDDGRFPSVDVTTAVTGVARSTLITDVRDNQRDGVEAKFYRIVPGGLREDAPAYVDREHEWNGIDASGIPSVLLGADYVMPFNGDKLLPKLNVTLTIGRPAMLYVFLSDIAKVPGWLEKDFKRTQLRIGLDESAEFSNPKYRLAVGPGNGINTKFSVWSREIPEPRTITLGSIEQGIRAWGFCMYGMAAVPLEKARQYEAATRSQSTNESSTGR